MDVYLYMLVPVNSELRRLQVDSESCCRNSTRRTPEPLETGDRNRRRLPNRRPVDGRRQGKLVESHRGLEVLDGTSTCREIA